MSNPLRAVSLLLLASSLALPACKSSDVGKAKQRKVTVKVGGVAAANAVSANVAEFDPNADFSLDLDAYGGERPDEYAVQQAFFNQFGALDICVLNEKERTKSDTQLAGDVTMAVKLNPKDSKPFGINATMPESYIEATALTDCLRDATAGAPYPTYDGPPVVVEFEFELDPGYVTE